MQACWACFYVFIQHPSTDPGKFFNHAFVMSNGPNGTALWSHRKKKKRVLHQF